jgi:iron complex outermembrane recepter protein
MLQRISASAWIGRKERTMRTNTNSIGEHIRAILRASKARRAAAPLALAHPLALAMCCAWYPGAVTAADGPPATADRESSSIIGGQLEEIVVTATHRPESVLNIPYSIGVVNLNSSALAGSPGLDNLTSAVSGLSNVSQGGVSVGNNNNFVLRGINANPATNNRGDFDRSAPTVATYINEMPVFFPISLLDLDRVEVLRGPQGTLYGSGALGGALRFITKKPDLSAGVTGEVTVRAGDTKGANTADYGVDGILNLPVTAQAALRIVASEDFSAGYIKALGRVKLDANGVPVPAIPGDLQSGYTLLPPQSGTNDTRHTWARVTGLWQFSDTASLTGIFQHDDIHQADTDLSSQGFAGGLVDMSVQHPPGTLFTNPVGCPNPSGPAFGFIPVTCLGGNTAWPNGGTQYPATGRDQSLIPVAQPTTEHFNLASIEASVDFGFATFTSTSASSWIDETYTRDSTSFLESVSVNGAMPVSALYGYYPRLIAYDLPSQQNQEFTQEFRITSARGSSWDYIGGLYYENSRLNLDSSSPWPGLGAFCSSITVGTACFGTPGYMTPNPQFGDITYTNDENTRFRDVSAYGELTYHLTSDWQLTGGGRAFWERLTENAIETFPFCGAACANSSVATTDPALYALGGVVVDQQQAVHHQIYKLNTSYKLGDTSLAYFTFSEGYRRGGANRLPASGLQASSPGVILFRPDFVKNYEVGFKGSVGSRFSFDAAVYLVNWSNFQFTTISAAGYTLTANGNTAQSKGAEANGQYRLTDDLSLRVGYAFTHSIVTEEAIIRDYSAGVGSPLVPIATVSPGAHMPNVPEHSATVGLDYRRPSRFGGLWDFSVDGSYRSAANADFPGSAAYFRLNGYSLWNASMGYNSQSGAWRTSAYLQNIFNAEGITGGVPASLVGAVGQGVYATRPRIFGLMATRKF